MSQARARKRRRCRQAKRAAKRFLWIRQLIDKATVDVFAFVSQPIDYEKFHTKTTE